MPYTELAAAVELENELEAAGRRAKARADLEEAVANVSAARYNERGLRELRLAIDEARRCEVSEELLAEARASRCVVAGATLETASDGEEDGGRPQLQSAIQSARVAGLPSASMRRGLIVKLARGAEGRRRTSTRLKEAKEVLPAPRAATGVVKLGPLSPTMPICLLWERRHT